MRTLNVSNSKFSASFLSSPYVRAEIEKTEFSIKIIKAL